MEVKASQIFTITKPTTIVDTNEVKVNSSTPDTFSLTLRSGTQIEDYVEALRQYDFKQ